MNLRRALALAFLALAAPVVGCSHEIESPPLGKKAVVPDLVCTEQLTTKVTLTGSGFTPMPSKTLETTELLLPQVELDRKQDLSGGSASGTSKIPDDPAHPKDSKLHWTSETQMSFEVDPALKLDPGLYDIKVTNPDGKQTVIFAGGLAAVPRPTLTGTVPDLICDAEDDQTVVLTGTTLLQVGATLPVIHMGDKDFKATKLDGCKPVPGKHAEGDVEDCTSATFVIPKGTFQPGAYDVMLTNPEPANCASSDKISITVVPPPTVATIAADLVCDAQGDQSMTVTGTGFLQVGSANPTIKVGTQSFMPATVTGCTAVPGTFTEGAVQSCTTMTFVIPTGTLMPGDYPVVVVNPPPADCQSLETVNLHIAPPPSLTDVNPLAVCDAQGDQVVTIDGMGFLEVGTTLPTVTIGGSMFTPSAAGGCTPVTGTFTEGAVQECTSLTVTVQKGTFTKGSYPVTVKNPDPAGCSSTETVNLVVDDPPTVTGTAPKTLCAGGGNLIVNGSSFAQTATVSLQSAGQPSIVAGSETVNAGGTQINATFGGPLTVGNIYDVVVDNTDGCTDSPPHQQVSVVTGPIAFFADPDLVYTGVNTRVTIYLTTLTLPATVSLTPAGMATPVTALTVVGTVPGKPNRLQVVVPEGLAAGDYDLHVSDATGCPTVLPVAITVTSTTTVAIKSVVPPFGWTQEETPVSILRDTTDATKTAPFVATPRVFLNPATVQPAGNGCPALSTAIQLQSVSFVDTNTLTAVVPKAQPTCLYDVIVVNPDKTVGVLDNGFTVQSVAPPTISTVTPSSIVAATGQVVTVAGKNFATSKVTLTCKDATGNPVTAPAVVSGADTCDAQQNCTQKATIDGSTLANGDVCVLRETNGDASFFDFSAIGVTNTSLNTPAPVAGTDLNIARRALIAAAGDATRAARFVYAIGGDGGSAMANAPFNSTEFASVDLFGKLGAWQLQATSSLATARSFAASATMGRYIYVTGGSDGTTALNSAERAMILDPLEVPGLDIDDLVPAATGLDAGYWFYRVSATYTASDLDNPGGESLPSDEFIVKVPTFPGKKIQVILAWSAPVDKLGAPLPNVAGYNIYRTPMVNGASGGEVLIGTVGASSLKFTDDGTATPGTQTVLPLGSTGKWAQLPAMIHARKGAAGAAGFDPSDPTKFYFYALLGYEQGANALTSYEYLPVTIAPNGHQTAATWIAGLQPSAVGRSRLGAWVADSTVSSTITSPNTFIYLGGGVLADGNTLDGTVEAGKIGIGGDLGVIADPTGAPNTVKDFSSNAAGYGVCAANGQLFLFGGAGAAPSSGAKSAALASPPPSLANNSWNAEGSSMVHPRYLMGSAVQSAFIFLVAGDTGGGVGSKTTETVIW